jgi:hypothetical protein
MELGENSLDSALNRLKLNWRTENNQNIELVIVEIIMQILEALKEMHKCNL